MKFAHKAFGYEAITCRLASVTHRTCSPPSAVWRRSRRGPGAVCASPYRRGPAPSSTATPPRPGLSFRGPSGALRGPGAHGGGVSEAPPSSSWLPGLVFSPVLKLHSFSHHGWGARVPVADAPPQVLGGSLRKPTPSRGSVPTEPHAQGCTHGSMFPPRMFGDRVVIGVHSVSVGL